MFAVVQMTFEPGCEVRPENIHFIAAEQTKAIELASGQTRQDLNEGKKFYYVIVESVQVETVDGGVGYMLAKSKCKKAQTFDGLKKVKRVYVEV
jgi:hypothetical protein